MLDDKLSWNELNLGQNRNKCQFVGRGPFLSGNNAQPTGIYSLSESISWKRTALFFNLLTLNTQSNVQWKSFFLSFLWSLTDHNVQESTGLPQVREKSGKFKVREKSGNSENGEGNLGLLAKVREMSGNFEGGPLWQPWINATKYFCLKEVLH